MRQERVSVNDIVQDKFYAVDEEILKSLCGYGQLLPVLLERAGNQYLVVDGIRRIGAMRELGIQKINAVIVPSADISILCQIVNKPSKIIKIINSYYDTLRRQGYRSDLYGDKYDAIGILSEVTGLSRTSVGRYIRMGSLCPEMLELLDKGRLSIRTAVELSYLDEDVQRIIVHLANNNNSRICYDVAKKIHERCLTESSVTEIYDLCKSLHI